eukprot:1180583-Prorocentrum_minimum.AAC.3
MGTAWHRVCVMAGARMSGDDSRVDDTGIATDGVWVAMWTLWAPVWTIRASLRMACGWPCGR